VYILSKYGRCLIFFALHGKIFCFEFTAVLITGEMTKLEVVAAKSQPSDQYSVEQLLLRRKLLKQNKLE
jgi:hypothetical protein